MSGEPRRIAFFTNTFAPDVNGVAHVVKAFYTELTRRGYEVRVFAPRSRQRDPFADDPHVCRYASLPVPGMDYALALPGTGPAARELKQQSFDLVHTHHPLWVGQWGARLARQGSLPLVTTIHTHYELFARLAPLPQGMVRSYLRRTVTRYCNACDLVTTPAESNRQRLVELGVRPPVVVVPNPIDFQALQSANGAAVRQRLGLEDKFVMGYLGRLSPEKRIEIVVEAAALVCHQRPDAHLVLVGGGTARERIERALREHGLQDRTTLVGPVPHDQVADYHAAFDVFLTASEGETQPLAYAEAMAVGTPVVAVAEVGAVDMVRDGHNGFLVDKATPAHDMARAVLRLAHDRGLLARLAAQARRDAQQYDIAAATDRLCEAYELAVARARAAADE
ncbi:MAG: glycosyltransferase [Armatimonadetes bacterium]|nr:glycosyltransferase [Armatimonadota bacterium]